MINNAKKGIIIAGHRGNRITVSENTLESFQSAIDMHADMIETDIHMTKDGILVLMHDDNVQTTSDGEGYIRDLTFEEIRKLNVGTSTQKMLIPTLEELLKMAAPVKDFLLDLELKVYFGEDTDERVYSTVDETIKLVEKYNMRDRIVLNCFDAKVLEYIHKTYFDGEKNIYPLHGYYPYDILRNVNENPDNYLDYACYWGDGKAKCDYLISKKIVPCTGNTSKEDFFQDIQNGCKIFTVDDPLTFLKWREELN